MSHTTKQLSITVASDLAITTTALPDGKTGTAYSGAVAASGGSPPISFRLAVGSGPLPQGLTLNADGSITGTPTVEGTFAFTVEALDANG